MCGIAGIVRSDNGFLALPEMTALVEAMTSSIAHRGPDASGLWSDQAVASQDAAEVEAVEDELLFRLRAIERAAVLRAGELPEEDAQRLRRLCDSLAPSGADAR